LAKCVKLVSFGLGQPCLVLAIGLGLSTCSVIQMLISVHAYYRQFSLIPFCTSNLHILEHRRHSFCVLLFEYFIKFMTCICDCQFHCSQTVVSGKIFQCG